MCHRDRRITASRAKWSRLKPGHIPWRFPPDDSLHEEGVFLAMCNFESEVIVESGGNIPKLQASLKSAEVQAPKQST